MRHLAARLRPAGSRGCYIARGIGSHDPFTPHRPGRAALRACAAARVWRNGAHRARAGHRARSSWSRGDDVRERRFDRSGAAHRDRPGGVAPARLRRRFLAVHATDAARSPRPYRRVRHHPRPPRVGEPAAGARQPDPGRDDVPRPAGSAVGGRPLPRSTCRARRDQREPGEDPPRRPVGRGRAQRPAPDRHAVRRQAHRRPVLRRAGRAREGDRRGDRHRQGDRSSAADRGQGRPHGSRARVLRERVPSGPEVGGLARRVPRRARSAGPRPALRAELRLA